MAARDARARDLLVEACLFRESSQTRCGVFGSDVALGHAQHFKTYHEFTDCRGTQERRVEVGVEVPFRMRRAIYWRLMEAHGVGEADVEEVVIAGGEALEDVGEGVAFVTGELGEQTEVAAGEDHGFEGPDGPPGNEGGEVAVFDDDSIAGGALGGEIAAEQAGAFFGEVGLLGFGFQGWFVGDVAGGPDLAVGVGVAGAHHGSAIFEDLDVVDPVDGGDLFGFGGPGVDDAAHVRALHLGKGEAVVGMEAEDFADSLHRLGGEQG